MQQGKEKQRLNLFTDRSFKVQTSRKEPQTSKNSSDLSSPTFYIFKIHKKRMNCPKRANSLQFPFRYLKAKKKKKIQEFYFFSHCCQLGWEPLIFSPLIFPSCGESLLSKLLVLRLINMTVAHCFSIREVKHL